MSKYRVEWTFRFSGSGFSTWDADNPEQAEVIMQQEWETNRAEFLNSVSYEEFEVEDITEAPA